MVGIVSQGIALLLGVTLSSEALQTSLENQLIAVRDLWGGHG